MVFVALCVAVTCSAKPALAYRPFDSTDAAVAAQGELELELGPVGYLRAGHRGYAAPLEVLNLGVLERWELVLQGQELAALRPGGEAARVRLVDTGALVKGVLREGTLQGKSGLSIATEIGALLPTVNDEPGAGANLNLIVSHRLDVVTFHVNLEGARTRAGNADGFAGGIVEGPFLWPLRPVAEVYVEHETGAASTFSTLVGFIAPLNDELSLDGGTRLALVSGAEVFEARAGFTWSLRVWR